MCWRPATFSSFLKIDSVSYAVEAFTPLALLTFLENSSAATNVARSNVSGSPARMRSNASCHQIRPGQNEAQINTGLRRKDRRGGGGVGAERDKDRDRDRDKDSDRGAQRHMETHRGTRRHTEAQGGMHVPECGNPAIHKSPR